MYADFQKYINLKVLLTFYILCMKINFLLSDKNMDYVCSLNMNITNYFNMTIVYQNKLNKFA